MVLGSLLARGNGVICLYICLCMFVLSWYKMSSLLEDNGKPSLSYGNVLPDLESESL